MALTRLFFGAAALSMLITAAFGIFTVCGYWLTFFPPAWYRKRVEGASAQRT